MDYAAMALELMQKTNAFRQAHMQEKATGVLRGEFFMLNVLKDAHTPMQPRDLSDELQVSTARVAALLNSLEKKGYVERSPDLTDRRKIIVTITPAGLQFSNQHHAHLRRSIETMLAALGETDAKEYVRLVGRILEVLADTNFIKELPHDQNF